MIISHKYHFIYIAIPKTASQSVREYIYPYLGNEDWEQSDYLRKARFPFESISNKGHGHLTYEEVLPIMHNSIIQKYTIFCIIRDPIDRFVSALNYKFRFNAVFLSSPVAFAEAIVKDDSLYSQLYFKPQTTFISQNGQINSNIELIPFAKLNENLPEYLQTLSIPVHDLPRLNTTKRILEKDKMTSDTLKVLERIYQTDISLYEQIL